MKEWAMGNRRMPGAALNTDCEKSLLPYSRGTVRYEASLLGLRRKTRRKMEVR